MGVRVPSTLVAVATWSLVVAGGFAVTWRYAATPGIASAAPARWPDETRLSRPHGEHTLLMFVHPRCSCSVASVTELGRLLSRTGGRVSAQVVFARPRGTDESWSQGSLRQQVARLPGVTLFDDTDEIEAHRFGAATSGATLLYGGDGRLEFAGGLTAVRGHEGDSFGEERIVAIAGGRTPDRSDSPVFGCPLSDALEATQ
jgi:hypothetical protein